MARIRVEEAARKMNLDPQALRVGLRQDRELARPQFPFGKAVKMEKRWVYWVWEERLEQFLNGELQ